MTMLYRYFVDAEAGDVQVRFREFHVDTTLPGGWWIERFEGSARYITEGATRKDRGHYLKFVRKGCPGSWAHPTKEGAMRHFLKRTRNYSSILESRMQAADVAVRLAEAGRIGEAVNVSEYLSGFAEMLGTLGKKGG